ncbi:MAG TPA: hypothetical protein VKE72_07065 [Methylocella sp.]|nr:hypothetical protein [Methylocella sp.]
MSLSPGLTPIAVVQGMPERYCVEQLLVGVGGLVFAAEAIFSNYTNDPSVSALAKPI